MQLTVYSDYSLRMLLYLAVSPAGATMAEIAEAYGISRNHLVKIAQQLRDLGYITATRGREGGLHLAMDPESINIGKILRETEPSFDLLECFDPETNTCPIIRVCRLRTALHEANRAFFDVLDSYHLSDMLVNPSELQVILDIDPGDD